MQIVDEIGKSPGAALRWVAALARAEERIARILLAIAALAVLMAIAVNVADVAGRNIFGKSLAWSDEFLTYLMIWIVLIGMISVTAQNGHITVDIMEKGLGRRLVYVQEIISTTGVVALALYLVPFSLQFVEIMYNSGKRSIDAGFPMWIVHSAVVLGFGLSAAISLTRLIAVVLLLLGRKDLKR